MKKLLQTGLAMVALIFVVFVTFHWYRSANLQVDYNRDVKPILNKHCLSCHGGVRQNGGFSLLFEQEAKSPAKSGKLAIVPGQPENSEMIRRVTSKDPEERMPYEKAPLSQGEIKILKKWIKQGAPWGKHWAYQSPINKAPKNPDTHAIDYFIDRQLNELSLPANDRANSAILVRRLALDLTGLPPAAFTLQKIPSNPSEEYLSELTERLLNSPHFGEKWAGMWMDLARYADTKGYERDDIRQIWAYRDWLIRAFNSDMPYNQFLTEQLAGDLLPHPTDDQLIATAFHRNTMTNDEGGTNNEEFRVAAVIDRVNTTWEVLMGTTFACVQCHSHPYDPFTHKDYYRFLAFFNNTRDEDTYDDYPVFRHFNNEDSIKLLNLKKWLNQSAEQAGPRADADRQKDIIQFVKTWQPSYNSLVATDFVNSELADTKWLVFRNHGSARLQGVDFHGKTSIIFRYKSFLPGGHWQIHLDSVDGPLLKDVPVATTHGRWTISQIPIKNIPKIHDLVFTYQNPNLKNPLHNGLMIDWLHFASPFPGKGTSGYEQAKKDFWGLVNANTQPTPIMQENPPEMRRTTHVFVRGNWLTHGEKVQPGVPAVLNGWPADAPLNRLGLARWIVSNQNPLTARTYVNRIWEQLFGSGLVETLEDFGSQGSSPSNQPLLDHLAGVFINDLHWSTKALIRYIVSSEAYRRSAVATPQQLEVDPQNLYLARGSRYRLSAEEIRDQALVISGLYNPKMYGPSVMPYQPKGIWNSPYNSRKWEMSKGKEKYRRAVYTYWKRTGPYPSMELFDVMAREVCTARRITTNTPLQALVTLNDSAFVEMAQHFALRMEMEGGDKPQDQIKYGYELMMSQPISQEKLQILLDLYHHTNGNNLYRKVANTGGENILKNHLKSMEIVANAMLNLDEFLTKN